ncbi:MAG: hypothetical protein PUC41_09155 [Oscillospiraceae bacterium]|nr:hypothetical protein [Oscillospiraceae bacterium]
MNTATILRRIRIRSWTDVVMIAIAIGIIMGGQWLLEKLFPNMSEKTAYTISLIIAVVFVFVWVFTVPVP